MLSTPLGQHILDYDPPRGFSIPPFAMYDGSSDPYDHMLHFNQAMIFNIGDDRLLCKVFLAIRKGPALAWFHKLLRGSVRPEKFQFLEKDQNCNFGYKIVISIKNPGIVFTK